jgi:hypothetical protein
LITAQAVASWWIRPSVSVSRIRRRPNGMRRLGGDADRRLLGRPGAEIEPDR